MVAFGDPHVQSFASRMTNDYQTCNELSAFKNSSDNPLVASEYTNLIHNDYFNIMALMGRYTSLSSGTFIQEVCFYLYCVFMNYVIDY